MSKSHVAKFDQQDATVAVGQSFLHGFMIAFLNPKLAIFFLALFGQFVDAQASWQQNVIMVSTVAGIDTLWYCLIAIVLSQSILLDKLRENVHIVEKAYIPPICMRDMYASLCANRYARIESKVLRGS
ncbi:MAG: threonine/homoserine/homoserine lactone efflux protein [Moritella sp.]|jgi:threonine/homoserine/homoserine lactone efflux protein